MSDTSPNDYERLAARMRLVDVIELLRVNERLRDALRSIAENTCPVTWEEAVFVARITLRDVPRDDARKVSTEQDLQETFLNQTNLNPSSPDRKKNPMSEKTVGQGKWRVADLNLPEEYYFEHAIADENGKLVGASISLPEGRNHHEAERNAYLFAAAPTMLEALKTINRITSPGTRTFDELMRDMMMATDIARRAIALATTSKG